MKGTKLLTFSFSLLALSACSPKVKIGIWAERHQEAALALGLWSAANTKEAGVLLATDCSDPKQFKQKITDALKTKPAQPASQQDYLINQAINLLGNRASIGHPDEGFENWCLQYPKAAKRLRGHAKALCKTGLEVLKGTYKLN